VLNVASYLESLLEYMENYALRVRPLLDLNEVCLLDNAVNVDNHSRTDWLQSFSSNEPGLSGFFCINSEYGIGK